MGGFDGLFRKLTPKIVGLFSSTKKRFTKTVQLYDPIAPTQVPPVTTTHDIIVSPPVDYKIGEIDNINILAGDTWIAVPAVSAENEGLSLEPESQVTITVVIHGQKHKVQSIQPWDSGDQTAAYKVHLRK